MNRDKIHAEALKQVGNGQKGVAFELGAEWAFSVHPRINKLAEQAFNNAIIRGKTSKDATHDDTFFGIFEELREFREASEVDPSEHLPQYTASVEELADIAISALTELYARVDNVEEVIVAKINYNKTRV
jgi:hypothetical protein